MAGSSLRCAVAAVVSGDQVIIVALECVLVTKEATDAGEAARERLLSDAGKVAHPAENSCQLTELTLGKDSLQACCSMR